MNLAKQRRAAAGFLHAIYSRLRTHLPRQQCNSFPPSGHSRQGVGPIYVINLDREPGRWRDILRELAGILDAGGKPLSDRVVRYPAYDARDEGQLSSDRSEIEPFYTLGDQFFVEPQPDAMPSEFDLERPIKMSRAEVAVARSHVGVWKTVAKSPAAYALVLEDDVWFTRGFARSIDLAWHEMKVADSAEPAFDILYVSYTEVRHGAPKEFLSENLFRPVRGLWCLSGYILSQKGARALLRQLPCQGPVDLWINLKFTKLDVRALRRSVINQRRDTPSTNSYSVLPTLTRIGVLDYNDTALFNQRPSCFPVFVFGAESSGLSSMATALSMLGYRCCSDLDQIPEQEMERLIAGAHDRTFNAYVNIGSLGAHVGALVKAYPLAKFIIVDDGVGTFAASHREMLNALQEADVLHLHDHVAWRSICEHLRLPPPAVEYPTVQEIGQRRYSRAKKDAPLAVAHKQLRHDLSPWVVEQHTKWPGIPTIPSDPRPLHAPKVKFVDNLEELSRNRWLVRDDTFPGNLGLFRPTNIRRQTGGGFTLTVDRQSLGVRDLGAAAFSSQERFLYGRFEATLQATNVSGLVTGFFLYRNSPRQEIDIEITGNRPSRLLVNVFYNPGTEGAKYDYGYRGTPTSIPLKFDASKAPHRYAIEWDPCEIRWFVDDQLVHSRVDWNPTPIPNLPMTLHLNTWPTRSRELAGRLAFRALPAVSIVHNISVDACSEEI